ncbi:MAG: aldo/keto reductase, partial [SAR202 cluster bacterium]|nr:aldo/keto reductase [SAR202 cluster bacterium]
AGEGPGYTPEQLAIAGRMDRLGGEWGHAPTTLAIGWLLAKPIVASAVVGATRVESLDEAIAAADAALTEAHLRELDAVGR